MHHHPPGPSAPTDFSWLAMFLANPRPQSISPTHHTQAHPTTHPSLMHHIPRSRHESSTLTPTYPHGCLKSSVELMTCTVASKITASVGVTHAVRRASFVVARRDARRGMHVAAEYVREHHSLRNCSDASRVEARHVHMRVRSMAEEFGNENGTGPEMPAAAASVL